MGISASGVQAAAWMISGANVSSELKATMGAELEGTGVTLLTKSGKNAVAVTCTTAKATEALLEAEGKGQGKVNFESCTTKVNGTLSSKCTPINQPIKAGAEVAIVKHEGVTYVKAEGTGGGGAFTTIEFEEECLLIAEPITLSGTACSRTRAVNSKLKPRCT